ncbi:ATP-binding protein [Paraburkholderia sp. HD33-4]|uniref:ATP-binding protein n=1 Tax=Paraburkholderia sp. HD33-4 TaxID=2883242 RepID=UPI001F2FC61A|nr:ATP-binding protein [Paraburkholderia sp. HD33-4]
MFDIGLGLVTHPYPGLRPFQLWEAEIFFGREAHTNRLLEILGQRHFLAVIGPSGSGKSSLVRAGLLPALPVSGIGHSTEWRMAIMRPGDRPIQSLARTLLGDEVIGHELSGIPRSYAASNRKTPPRDIGAVQAELRRGPRGLLELVSEARKHSDPDLPPFNLLVLVDQFEELFTYAEAGCAQNDESEAFVNLLLTARSEKAAGIYVALTMRTDFLGNCVRFLDLPEAINRAQYLTPRLDRDQMREAIVGPAQMFGGDVKEGIVTEIINTVGSDMDQLPIMQHALAQMWEHASKRETGSTQIGRADFDAEEVGGVRGALSLHADRVLKSLSPEDRQAAEWLFRAITEQREGEGGGQAVRRPQALELIGQWSGHDWKDFKPVIAAFAHENVNFLTYDRDPDRSETEDDLRPDTVIDISHEALIRQWTTLKEWVQKEARLGLEYRRLRERAKGAHLRGADLARAEEWKGTATAPATSANAQAAAWHPNAQWASRYTLPGSDPVAEFNDVSDYIDRSSAVVQREKDKEKRTRHRLYFLMIGCLLFAVLAGLSSRDSRRSRLESTAQLLWRPINMSSSQVTAEVANGLITLAREKDEQKREFLSRAFNDDELARSYTRGITPILASALGISVARRDWLIGYLNEFDAQKYPPRAQAKSMTQVELGSAASPAEITDTLVQTQDTTGMSEPGSWLDTAIHNLDDTQAEVLSNRIVDALPDKLFNPPLLLGLQAVLPRVDAAQTQNLAFRTLAKLRHDEFTPYVAFLSVAKQLNHDQAAILTGNILGVMRESDSEFLPRALAAVAEKLDEVQSEALIQEITGGISDARSTLPNPRMSDAFARLLDNVSTVRGREFAAKFVALSGAAQHSPAEFSALAPWLTAVAPYLDPDQANAVVARYLRLVQDPKTPHEQFDQLAKGLHDLASELPEQFIEAQDQIVKSAVQTHDLKIVAALLPDLDPAKRPLTDKQQLMLRDQIMRAFGRQIDADMLTAMFVDLTPVASKLTVTQAGMVADRIIASRTSAQVNADLSSARFVKELGPDQTRLVAEKLITAGAKENGPAAVAHYLVFLVPGLNNARATSSADSCIDILVTYLKKNEPFYSLELRELTGNITAAQVTRIINNYFQRTSGESARIGLSGYSLVRAGEDLSGLVRGLDQQQRMLVVPTILNAISSDTGATSLRALAPSIARVANQLNDDQTVTVVKSFISAFKILNAPDHTLMQQLTTTVMELRDPQAEKAWDEIFSAVRDNKEGLIALSLHGSMRELAQRIRMNDTRAKEMIELSRYPFVPRETFAEVVRKAYANQGAPTADKGYWEYLKWAEDRFPDTRDCQDLGNMMRRAICELQAAR